MHSLQQLRYPAALHLPGTPSLALEQVSVRFNGLRVLGEISFEIAPGERVAVVGPNGAGKSTLLKAIAGTLKPTTGRIQIFGQPPGGHICIGYVPQRNQIDWRFPVTVADVVMMGRAGKIGLFRWPHKRDWALVQQALAQVNMTALAQRQIGELSGGQQQRVFVARALAQEAEILLLDEPLTGLDAPNQEAFFAILDTLRQQRVTVLVATHDLDQAATRFDRMMLLNRRLVAFGAGDAVYTPANLVRAYGGHVHLLPGEQGSEQVVLADTCCEGE